MTEGRNSNRPSAVMDYIACMMEQDEMTVNTKTQYPEKHHSRTHFLMVLALLYWLPVETILTGMVPFSLRSLLLLLMFVFTAIYALMQGHSAAELGLENFNLRTSPAVNLPAGITAAGVVFSSCPSPGSMIDFCLHRRRHSFSSMSSSQALSRSSFSARFSSLRCAAPTSTAQSGRS